MQIYSIDPLTDSRWPQFLARVPDASIFHTAGWLGALQEAYGYLPVVYTTSALGSPLENAVAFCHVRSWLTGKRLVSLPFADHCQPLIASPEALEQILAHVAAIRARSGYRYVELRALRRTELPSIGQTELGVSHSYAFHSIDLTVDEAALFEQLHKTSIKQMIGRAQREGLSISRGRDEQHREQFYTLLLQTRRKHKVPPQPRSWYRILAERLGDAITFHIASHEGKPVAAIVTLDYRQTIVHKYGCSNPAESHRGGTQLLLWEAIRLGKSSGAVEFDMGRSDLDNSGLVRFKERWGGIRTDLQYQRIPTPVQVVDKTPAGWKTHMTEIAFAYMPDTMLELAGRLLYKHVG
ncbi:MAG: GNAT family N-acetyltransferase [bacterium]|nr:GNAT family N-acetyltransferase [bacterium]